VVKEFAMFGHMLNEKLTLKKRSTGHLHNFQASVQPNRSLIFTDNANLPVEEGDTIERPLRTSLETYTVVERGYYEEVNGIPAHYQMKVRKSVAEEVMRPAPEPRPQGSDLKKEQPPSSAVSLRENSRRTRLRELLDGLSTLRLCGPSDDPEEQTSVVASYRYLLINIRALCKGIMPSDVYTELYAVPSEIETIYDVYESKAHLDAVCVDVRTELEFPTSPESAATKTSLIAPQLIEDLSKLKPGQFDAKKLTGYCREINSSFYHGNIVACLLLMRTVLNHVPPVFSYRTFSEVTANAGKSLKDNMEHLESGLRKLADLYAHQPIRKNEQYPTKSQVEPFRAQFELLLHEVLNKLQ
jgi:hypothetical protein